MYAIFQPFSDAKDHVAGRARLSVQTLSSAINSRAINPPSIEGRGAEGYPLETHLQNHAHVNSRYFWPCMKSIFLASS